MNIKEKSDEIDLVEIFTIFWMYKFIFVTIFFTFLSFAALYIINAERIYTSTSTFIAPKNSKNNFPGLSINSSGARSLAAFSGFPLLDDENQRLIERLSGREFVLSLADDLKLRDDEFFNKYDPNAPEPFWKQKLKSLINWKSTRPDPLKIAEWNVLKRFAEQVEVLHTAGGAIQVTVNHTNAEKAAEIANYFTKKAIFILQSEEQQKANELLNYLSQSLAESLINLEEAEGKLKKFLIANTSAASVSFQTGSLVLGDLRAKREKATKQLEAIEELLSQVKQASATHQTYTSLRNKYPLLDQPEFRRILGIPENVSAWRWPSTERLIQVKNSILDRSGALSAEILRLEVDAKKYGVISEKQMELTRKFKLAESLHAVLMEQVKAQSLAAGFAPDNSQIISAADAALKATKPNNPLILALAALASFFVYAFLALVLSWNKGAIYSRGALLKALNPKFHHKIQPVHRYGINTLRKAQEHLVKRPTPWLRYLFLETIISQDSSIVVVGDTTHLNNASNIARLIGASAFELGTSVAYVDLSKKSRFEVKNLDETIPGTKNDLEISETINGCTEYNYLGGNQNIDWLLSRSFEETVNLLKNNYDILLLSANLHELKIVCAGENLRKATLVIHAKKGSTKYVDMHELHQQEKIDIALTI